MKKFIQFLIYSNITFVILVFALSCNQPTNVNEQKDPYQVLQEYFKAQHQFELSDKQKRIIVITQNHCMSCNKIFASLVLDNINDSSSVILVTSDGSGLDIGPFKQHKGLVFFDSSPEIEGDILSSTIIIKLQSMAIDTIVKLDARTLEVQFSWFLNDIAEK
ncbi:MAG: hypothetical protein PHW82_17425 [Bacteroidales bacterium]|nr:hypothetical protein [Bacteroidales bacterium]